MSSGLPLNIDWQQILLHFFNFVILVGGLYILIYKPVKDFMEGRNKYYQDIDDKAAATLKNAQESEKLYKEKIDNAEQEAANIKAQAAAEAKSAADKKIKAAESEAGKIIADAKTAGQKAHDEMIESAKEEVASLAAMAAAKILDEQQDMYESFAKAVK